MGVICSPDSDNFKERHFLLAAAFAVAHNGRLRSFTARGDSYRASSQRILPGPSRSSEQSSDGFSSDVTSPSFLAPGPSQLFGENTFSQDQSNLAFRVDEVPLFQDIKLSSCDFAENSSSSTLIRDDSNSQSLSGVSSSTTRHSNDGASSQDLPCSSEMDVTVVNEGISTPINLRVLRDNSVNVLQRAFSRIDNNVTSERFWIEMHDLQLQWIQMIPTSSFNRSAAVLYTLACWKVLMKVFSMFRKRPKGFDESIQFYVVDAIKFLEFLTLRGYHEVSNLLTKFVITVIGRYLRKPEKMNETSQTWIQSREMLRIVCQTPTNFDTVLEIIVAVDEMKSEFLKMMTCDREERNIEFICYAMEQINDLIVRATHRLQQCQRSVRPTPPF